MVDVRREGQTESEEIHIASPQESVSYLLVLR
jgi:hypothetical protein